MTEPELRVFPDVEATVAAATELVANRALNAASAKGSFVMAASGGRTPWAMYTALARQPLPWPSVTIFQVDERVAPAGDDERNLTHLEQSLGQVRADVVAMPVEDEDLEAAAARYAGTLPERFDLVHLGLGPDGHTASLVPGDPILGVRDRLVAVTGGDYQGVRRMSLTYPALSRTAEIMWLVTGEDKHEALVKLVGNDPSIPASAVEAPRSVVVCDRAAAGNLSEA